jgi:hypothetical protein
MNADKRQKMIAYLVRKGYDRASIEAKDAKGLQTLYDLYEPPEPKSAGPSEWKFWRGTNRPHTSG